MKPRNYLLILLFLLVPLATPGQSSHQTIQVSSDIKLIKLSEHVYVHVSKSIMPGFGMVSSNGVIVVDKKEAILLDTPVTEAQTETLVQWITDSLHVTVAAFVPNHWHADCIGGLDYLHRIGVKSYAYQQTIDLARKNGLPVPQHKFKKRKVLRIGDIKIVCYYLGAAHSTDNIVVWIPSERILFPGCMVKDAASTSLGNLADGYRIAAAYPGTNQTSMKRT